MRLRRGVVERGVTGRPVRVLRRGEGQAGPGLRRLARHLPGPVGEGTPSPPGPRTLLPGQRLRGLRLLSHGSGRVRGAG
ncbi:hypothetical protein J3368_17805, partial [Streptomyces sampsonii]|nr:hypothetical protein [Streptomyces sampsonii]